MMFSLPKEEKIEHSLIQSNVSLLIMVASLSKDTVN